jgi:hypothetical protein
LLACGGFNFALEAYRTVKPVLQALVLADHVYEDAKSRKKIIVGTFNRITFKKGGPPTKEIELPSGETQKLVAGGMESGSPYAYISVTDVCDHTELKLQFVNLSKNKVLFGTKVLVSCNDRLTTIELVFPLPRLPVTEEGTYAFEVICDGEIIGSHRIVAEELKTEE